MNDELGGSIEILRAIHGEIHKMCESLVFAYTKAKSEGDEPDDNWHSIMSTIAASIILRTCAFEDEIVKYFKKEFNEQNASINGAIDELAVLLSKYEYRTLRNAVIAHGYRIDTPQGRKRISYQQIVQLVPTQSHSEYLRFGEATSKVINAILSHFVPTGT
jgi:hypothetical protein